MGREGRGNDCFVWLGWRGRREGPFFGRGMSAGDGGCGND